MKSFVHLSVHSTYSIQDGLAMPGQLADWAREHESPAIALTDAGNLFAAVKFSNACQAAGVKPILGLDVRVSDNQNQVAKITLLARNEAGYKNLCYISTQLLRQETAGPPSISREFIAEHSAGLLILSGAQAGDVGQLVQQGNIRVAERQLQWWLDLVGDNYYLELQRLGLPNEEEFNQAVLHLARKYNCPPLATNPVLFMQPDDFEVHRARVNINRAEIIGREAKPQPYRPTQYLRTPAEMAKLFHDLPAVIENTYYAAQRCNFIIRPQLNLPHYPFAGSEGKQERLARLAAAGLAKLLGEDWAERDGGAYHARLAMELKVINDMHYNDYFLIVSDFVNWAKQQDIPVGPGRGSGGGSLVAYATGITTLDPLSHNLLFERFLNPGRSAMPDFDIDVCVVRREEIINYLQEAFGKENVVQIVSFGTMGPKAVVRDANRVLGKPYSLGDRLAGLVPFMARTLAQALELEDELGKYISQDAEAKQVFDLAQKLEGQVRHTGLHAAGLVIAPGPVKDYCPLLMDSEGKLICQYDKDDLEIIGLVKFDILGLRNLTVIHETLKLLKQHDEQELAMENIPYDDPETMRNICAGKTYAVFQLESSGMRDVARRMQPKVFEDIVALIALYRPGPMDLIDDFISNKQKLERGEAIDYPDPSLEDILKPTYGIAVYQEQVMQMAQKVAGYDLSQADILRRAMGKKKKEVMEQQRADFIKGAAANGHAKKKAEELFATIEKFAGYGFNRSHSVGYGVLAYWTAYLKTHHKAHYLTANMSTELGDTRKIASLAEECRQLGIKLLAPDVNHSSYKFSLCQANGDYAISYGLAAIKGVGVRAARRIAEEAALKPYENFFDFCRRLEPNYLSAALLESLVRAGAFASLEQDYSALYAMIAQGLQLSKQQFQESTSGLSDMFGENLQQAIVPPQQKLAKWSKLKAAREEAKALGFYLRHDLFKLYQPELRKYIQAEIASLADNQEVTICGRIYGLSKSFVNNGKIYRWQLIDESGEVKVQCYEDKLGTKESILKNDNIIAVSGKKMSFKSRNGSGREDQVFQALSLYDLGELRASNCRSINISVDVNELSEKSLQGLSALATANRAPEGLPINIKLLNVPAPKSAGRLEGTVNIMQQSRVLPTNLFMVEVEELLPSASISYE